MTANEENEFLNSDEKNQKNALPIFPSREAVKFQTDRITLSIFEERYLSLSDYVLQQDTQSQSCDHPSHYGSF